MSSRLFLVLAPIGMLHAAFCTYEHLSHLKALGRPESPIPNSVIFETFLALVLGIFGAVINAPTLKEITWSSEMRRQQIDDMDSRLGFASYVNRGTELFRKHSTDQSIRHIMSP